MAKKTDAPDVEEVAEEEEAAPAAEEVKLTLEDILPKLTFSKASRKFKGCDFDVEVAPHNDDFFKYFVKNRKACKELGYELMKVTGESHWDIVKFPNKENLTAKHPEKPPAEKKEKAAKKSSKKTEKAADKVDDEETPVDDGEKPAVDIEQLKTDLSIGFYDYLASEGGYEGIGAKSIEYHEKAKEIVLKVDNLGDWKDEKWKDQAACFTLFRNFVKSKPYAKAISTQIGHEKQTALFVARLL